MDTEKVGNFIKEIRKKNNLTQKDLADKYGVTYQAVSKWENGINLPDVSLLRQMSKDFNISIEDILDGQITNTKRKNYISYIILGIILISIIILILIIYNKDDSYEFKTISASCEQYKITGSAAYSKDKTSIRIQKIDYCGDDESTLYKKIRYDLYINDLVIANGESTNYSTIKEYLEDIRINFDQEACLELGSNKLMLEITTINEKDEVNAHQMYLELEDNC